jgi:quinol monooxygenase YgiN
MSHNHRVVVALAVAKLGQEEQLKVRLEEVAQASWQEPGVITYAVHDVIDQPGQFMMVEVYASDQAFDDHVATDHVQDLIAELPDLIEGDLIIYHGRSSSFSQGPQGAL